MTVMTTAVTGPTSPRLCVILSIVRRTGDSDATITNAFRAGDSATRSTTVVMGPTKTTTTCVRLFVDYYFIRHAHKVRSSSNTSIRRINTASNIPNCVG